MSYFIISQFEYIPNFQKTKVARKNKKRHDDVKFTNIFSKQFQNTFQMQVKKKFFYKCVIKRNIFICNFYLKHATLKSEGSPLNKVFDKQN